MAIKLILHACGKGPEWLEVAAVIAIGYVFGFRVPSELLRQCRAELWKLEANMVHYGPVRRKHRDRPVVLARSCVCREAPVLCPHVWARFVVDHLPPDRSFMMTGADFNKRFRIFHSELTSEPVQGWTMQCAAVWPWMFWSVMDSALCLRLATGTGLVHLHMPRGKMSNSDWWDKCSPTTPMTTLKLLQCSLGSSGFLASW